jgi:hypothetical protein
MMGVILTGTVGLCLYARRLSSSKRGHSRFVTDDQQFSQERSGELSEEEDEDYTFDEERTR